MTPAGSALHTSTVRRTSTSASPRRPWDMRRSASAWHASGESASRTSARSRSFSQIFMASFSRKQSVRYTLAMAASTLAMRRCSPFLRAMSARVSSPPCDSASLSRFTSNWRSSRPFSNASTAFSPCSMCPSSTYLLYPFVGASWIDRCMSSRAPSPSPSSARTSEAKSMTSVLSGSTSRTLMYSLSAPSPSPRSASDFARLRSVSGDGRRPPAPAANDIASHRLSGSYPRSSIALSKLRTTHCSSPAITRATCSRRDDSPSVDFKPPALSAAPSGNPMVCWMRLEPHSRRRDPSRPSG
mmetsp:Transcript_28066/g.89534  ORF Transcript_28066/g.89534 Transcript_28066/m.89534 type:complete len:299 (-) Transcript_28066:60-956(-)